MSTLHARKEAEDFKQIAPAAYAAIMALGKAIEESGLNKQLLELVKIRASQINGCAFCAQLHLNIARKHDVAQEKLDLARCGAMPVSSLMMNAQPSPGQKS